MSDYGSRPSIVSPRIADILANREQSARDMSGVLMEMAPGIGDAIAAMDAYRSGREAVDAYQQGDTRGAAISVAEALANGVGALPLVPALGGVIKAYHGSPHRFDKFSMDKIGAGEGAQAYGHGLYFAEDPSVAKTYKSKVSAMQGQSASIDGRKIDWDSPEEYAAFELWRHDGDVEAAAEFAEKTFRNTKAAKLLRSGANLPHVDTPGALYHTDLDVNHEDLLDWDAPLSEQPKKIRDAVDKVTSSLSPEAIDDLGGDLSLLASGDRSAAEFYDTLSSLSGIGGNAQASEMLRRAGVPGIRYLDAGSRSAKDGTRNIVLFDDNLVSIDRVE